MGKDSFLDDDFLDDDFLDVESDIIESSDTLLIGLSSNLLYCCLDTITPRSIGYNKS